jgi:predicted unusual protein kinase regulating ubiquinone biosynthesis (AarF/ABC1/UbiB family)
VNEHHPVPRGRFVRGSILGTAVARATVKKAGNALTQPFLSTKRREQVRQKTEEDVAKLLFDACATLRGTPLKLLQLLATERELLPEPYREQFSRSSHQVDPINRALVRRLLTLELGDLKACFGQFDDRPFAAASLGQVHAATTLSGAPLAVKIQYPGIDFGVDADLKLVKALLSPTPWGPIFESCLGELRERLGEELDYRCEAQQTEWFNKHLRLKQVTSPRVFHEFTTKRVISTERLAGLHLQEYVAMAPSQSARNHFGQLLVDLFAHSIFELNQIHADPNFGNYLFRSDGTLGLIDFGCIRNLDASFVRTLRQLFTLKSFDGDALEELHRNLGVRYHEHLPRSTLRSFLLRWGQWVIEPHLTPCFDYSSRNEEYFRRGFELGREARGYISHTDGPFLYFGRAHHGLQRMLQTLGATVTHPSITTSDRY